MMEDMFIEDRLILERNPETRWETSSGMSVEELRKGCYDILQAANAEPYIITKAKVIAYIFENAQIEVNPYQYFSVRINHGDVVNEIKTARMQGVRQGEMKDFLQTQENAVRAYAFTGECDFSHTVPDWDAVLQLGIVGLLSRIQKKVAADGLTEEQTAFYDSCCIIYEAWIELLNRMANTIASEKESNGKMQLLANAINALAVHAPGNIFEAMVLMAMFYSIQTYVDSINLRSLGRLDKLLYPFYLRDLNDKVFTKDEIRTFIKYFYFHFYDVKAIAKTPFCLCGPDESNDEITNDLTWLLLDTYDEMNINDPKIHIRCGKNLPEEILTKTAEMIRAGRNSILYINDEVVFESMRKIGIAEEDLVNYVPVGCYEPTAAGLEVACSCAGRVNILKAVETAMYGGLDNLSGKQIGPKTNTDFSSFDEFYAVVKQQLAYFMEGSMNSIREYEKRYMQISPGPVFSSTLADCVEQGKDAYAGGAKYNNTSVCAFAIANAVDSLLAIRHAVFEDHIISMPELCQVLDQNWEGHEQLRQKLINLYPKYGNNNPEADAMMMDLVSFITSYINNKPNARGGVFRCGLFSIDWRSYFGGAASASADGRFHREALSKNMSAVVGRDKAGITSLINSVTKIDYTAVPNGAVLDVVLHYTAVTGSDGLTAMKALLKAFLKKGGIAMQINVLNPSVLIDAQKHPEKYSTLQVRLCGWNVYFVELDKFEQDHFIQQALEA